MLTDPYRKGSCFISPRLLRGPISILSQNIFDSIIPAKSWMIRSPVMLYHLHLVERSVSRQDITEPIFLQNKIRLAVHIDRAMSVRSTLYHVQLCLKGE
jgi:hypothetical protein